MAQGMLYPFFLVTCCALSLTELVNLHCHPAGVGTAQKAACRWCSWCIAHSGAEVARAPCGMLRPASHPALRPLAGARTGKIRALQMQGARLAEQEPAGGSTLAPGRPLAQQRMLAWPRRLQHSLMGSGGPRQAVSLQLPPCSASAVRANPQAGSCPGQAKSALWEQAVFVLLGSSMPMPRP